MEWLVLKNGNYFITVGSPQACLEIIHSLESNCVGSHFSYVHISDFRGQGEC